MTLYSPCSCSILLLLIASTCAAQTAGSYTTYGNGCAGSGVVPGRKVVVPSGFESIYGNAINSCPFGVANVRYMQSHDQSELPSSTLIRGMRLRHLDRQAQPAYALTIDINMGYTTNPTATLVKAFASNWSGTPSNVFRGRVNVPAVPAQTDPQVWTLTIPFSVPFVYSRARGHLLWECVNRTQNLVPLASYDAVGFSGAKVNRLWAYSMSATTGAGDRYYGLIVDFVSPRSSGQIVRLTNNGVPTIHQSFSIEMSGAVTNSTAILWLGAGQLDLSLGRALPGCSLYTSLDVVAGLLPTGFLGQGSLRFTLPNAPSLIGVRFYNQWMVVDPAANGLGIVLSNGGAGRIGG